MSKYRVVELNGCMPVLKGSTNKGNPSRVLHGWGPRICLSSDFTVSARALVAAGIKKKFIVASRFE